MGKLFFLTAIMMVAITSPASGRRLAIDQNPDGSPITATLGGYCDFNGDECGAGDGATLSYTVGLGGAAPTDTLFVMGNGLLSFGQAADVSVGSTGDDILNGNPVDPTAYGLTLVSIGQYNALTDDGFGGSAFQQSGALDLLDAGVIRATWYTCYAPSAQGVCPRSNVSTLTLTPVDGGYAGAFDGASFGDDTGFVVDGTFTKVSASTFFLPARFTGLTAPAGAVPEPASWALMLAGVGVAGAGLRVRARRGGAAA